MIARTVNHFSLSIHGIHLMAAVHHYIIQWMLQPHYNFMKPDVFLYGADLFVLNLYIRRGTHL